MKMLKRAGAIAIAGAMALTLGSVAYAADPTITVGKINIGEADENGIVTVTVPYTAENLADGAQVTLLAELGAAEKVYASNIVYDTTAYIDQDAAGSAFTFKINENRLTGTKDADVWLNVKVGGTGVAKAAEGSEKAYTYVAESQPEVFTVGDIYLDGEINISDVSTLYNYLAAPLTYKFTTTEGKVLPLWIADTFNDQEVNISDVSTLYNKLADPLNYEFEVAEYTLPSGVTAESTYGTSAE